MNNKIIVYYSPKCGHCHKQIRWLEQQNIKFEKRNVEVPSFLKEFQNRKGKGYPLSVITTKSGGEVEILGFNEKLLKKYLILTGL